MNDRGLRRLVDTLAEGAACRGMRLEWFFPDPRAGHYDDARDTCARCPVLGPCRAYGDLVEAGQGKTRLHGMLGGELPEGRHARRSRVA